MVKAEPDIKADTKDPAQNDRGESIGLMEPLLIGESSRHRTALTDLALELAQKSAGFRRSLPESLLASLADLVRAMNCYYSNLIEGHDTHPIDIERALKGDYSNDAKKRDLQLEAKAHIAVQQWIDQGALKGRAVAADAIREIHRRFCEALPEDLLWVEDPATKERIKVIPGELRHRDVAVGTACPGRARRAIPRFLQRFEEGLRQPRQNRHHPLDRRRASPSRLDSPVPRRQRPRRAADVARDAARGPRYRRRSGRSRAALPAMSMPINATSPPATCHGATISTAAGNLSEENLAEFTRFFLTTCIDQVTFMEGLMQPEQLRTRILLWAEEEIRLNKLPPKSGAVLEAVLYRGELPRGDAAAIVGTGDRQARRVVSALIERGVLTSESTRAPLRLAFPAALASRWMPGLFPERTA